MSNSSKNARDNRANQLNPAHPAFHQSRGASADEVPRLAEQHKSPPNHDASTETSRTSSNTSPVKPK